MDADPPKHPALAGGEDTGPPRPAGRSRVEWLLYAAAAAALVWVFHDTSWETLTSQLRAVAVWWLAPAVAADILSYYCQGVRWHYLLKPEGGLSPVKTTQAVYVGLFVNEILPMRLGEVAAAFLAGRWMALPIARIIPSMLIGRLLDGVWLALAVSLLLMSVPLPSHFEWAGNVFGIAVALGVLLFLCLLAPRFRARLEPMENRMRSRPGIRGKLLGWFADVLRGIHEIRDPRILLPAAVASLGVLVFQALAFWFVIAAYHLPVTILAGMAVFLIVHLGTAIPNAPANVGSFQLFTVLGLSLFGVERETAAGFSAGVFVILTIPLWILGALALSRTGLSLHSIRHELRRGD